MLALSNGFGKTSSNLKVLDLVPSLSALKNFFISSHSRLTGVGALGARYVSYGAGEYRWF